MESLHISLDLHFQSKIDFIKNFQLAVLLTHVEITLSATNFNYSMLFFFFFFPPFFPFSPWRQEPELHLLQELKNFPVTGWQLSFLELPLPGRAGRALLILWL